MTAYRKTKSQIKFDFIVKYVNKMRYNLLTNMEKHVRICFQVLKMLNVVIICRLGQEDRGKHGQG